METITSRENRWVKMALRLKMKKYRDKEGLFIMEGLRSVEDAFRQGKRDVVCFLTREASEQPRLSALFPGAFALHWLFLLVEEPLMALLSGTEHGQGVLAILPKGAADFGKLSFPLSGHYLLLDGVQDPGNLGTLVRTAAASGCKGLFLLEGTADPYSEKAVRSSMGSILRLPVYEKLTLADAARLKAESGVPFVGTALEGGVPYRSCGAFPDAVFLFGNEGNGIRRELLALCDKKLYIPMAGGVESLNVAVSAAVICFHFGAELGGH